MGRIWLSRLGIRPAIILSLEEVKSFLVSWNWSRISSLVYSIWSFLCIMLYKDYAIVTRLFLLTYTPWSRKRVRSL